MLWALDGSAWGPFAADRELGLGQDDDEKEAGLGVSAGTTANVKRIRLRAFEVWAARVRHLCPSAREGASCHVSGQNREGQKECGGNGKCDSASGWCFCWGDWFGAQCEHHPFRNSSYLPT